MLEKAIFETDPETTDVVVMTAKLMLPGNMAINQGDFDHYDRELMTAVVNRAETIGKEVKPLIVPTNNPLFAVINTAKLLQAQELILGASNKFTADEQLEQLAFYWMNVGEGQMTPLTVRVLSRQRDVYLDLGGGNRIPKISERKARSVEELRSAGIGVSRAMLVHAGTADGSDLFKALITMLDPHVAMTLVPLSAKTGTSETNGSWIQQDVERSQQLKREIDVCPLPDGEPSHEIVRLAAEQKYDLIVIGKPSESSLEAEPPLDVDYILEHAPCWVCVVTPTPIPNLADSPGS
jgi:nucleotide-binding universal stress UspA family protein